MYEIFSITNENLFLYLTAKNEMGREIIIVDIAARNETFNEVKIVEKLKTITSP